MVISFRTISCLLMFVGVSLWIAGCSSSTNAPKISEAKSETKSPAEGEHGHRPSAHGGIVVSIGSDNYHAEAVFEKGGVVRLYTLGQDESKILEVAAEELTGFAKADGATESDAIVFTPHRQTGDREGMTSLFIARLPKELVGQRVEITIPSIRIGGERFRLAFQSNPPRPEVHGMPVGVSADEERTLFLKPGGKYTDADIQANGAVVPSVKFRGIKAAHDVRPKVGDMLCPISMTKANPKFSWVVDGKTYEFCCPPCLDEFVSMAKERPHELQAPESYLKK